MRQKLASIIPHILFWFIILGMLVVPESKTFSVLFTILLIGGISFYLHYNLSKKFFYEQFSLNDTPKWLFLAIVSICLLSFIYIIILSLIFHEAPGYGIQNPIKYAFPVVLFFSISGMMFQGFHFSYIQRQKEQQHQTEKLSLELNLIRTQLNPHFLFNVLNNIDYFVRKDPDKASDSIIKLSELLRYLLYDTSERKGPLLKEVTFLEDYFHLQKQRIQDTADCKFEKDIGAGDTFIAPAIFLPFIENAFVHCPLNELGMFLQVKITALPDKVIFKVQNSKAQPDALADRNRKGLGIELTKKRLNFLYPELHTLNILDAETFYLVELVINTHENKEHNS